MRRGGCGSAADGVVAHKSYSGVSDTPSAPSKVASLHFLDVASTPLMRRGMRYRYLKMALVDWAAKFPRLFCV